jgi:hypothetical protein
MGFFAILIRSDGKKVIKKRKNCENKERVNAGALGKTITCWDREQAGGVSAGTHQMFLGKGFPSPCYTALVI